MTGHCNRSARIVFICFLTAHIVRSFAASTRPLSMGVFLSIPYRVLLHSMLLDTSRYFLTRAKRKYNKRFFRNSRKYLKSTANIKFTHIKIFDFIFIETVQYLGSNKKD